MQLIEKRQEQRARITGQFSDGSDRVEHVDTIFVAVTDGGTFEFDHDPTDDEITAKLSKPVDIEPTSISTKRDVFAAYNDASQRWAAMSALDAVIQASGTAKQKTGSTAMLDKAYQKAKRLAAAYADALVE